MDWEYRNVQFKTAPTWGVWSKLSDADLATLASLQESGWEVYHTVNIRGSQGFTAHILFMLRRERGGVR
ncbi:MAG: hypothetical protein ACYC5M_13835 [Anaerolineae bacterium]